MGPCLIQFNKSVDDATCALPMAKPLAPAPIFKNSLEYFLNCALAVTDSTIVKMDNKSVDGFIRTIFDKRLIKVCFHTYGLLVKLDFRTVNS